MPTKTPLQSGDIGGMHYAVNFGLDGKFDSVYFFMWPGWRTELESNRWHWSKQWARRLPVVLIQPELQVGTHARAVPEKRLTNVELLSVEAQSSRCRDWLAIGARQAGQIAAHMHTRGHRSPVLWFYNPHLVVAYALLPACARVLHATENYFDFSNLEDDWLNWYVYAIEISDLVVSCSNGVARSLVTHTQENKLLNLPNGCEFTKYSQPAVAQGDWSRRIVGWRQPGRLAVFAGNINHRLDFNLIETLVARYPKIGFVFAGPADLSSFSVAQRDAWQRILTASNVLALGRIPAEDLPALYWSCDVGIIPYRTDLPVIVENGFPLKTLEMAAAGLPVIASSMKPLREISAAVTVTSDTEGFCAAIATHSRRNRSQEQCRAAESICRKYDYDMLFEQMARSLSQRIGGRRCATAEFAKMCDRIGMDQFIEAIIRLKDPPKMWQRVRFWLGTLLAAIPAKTRQRIPEPIRRLGRPFVS